MSSPLSREDVKELVASELQDQLHKHQRDVITALQHQLQKFRRDVVGQLEQQFQKFRRDMRTEIHHEFLIDDREQFAKFARRAPKLVENVDSIVRSVPSILQDIGTTNHRLNQLDALVDERTRATLNDLRSVDSKDARYKLRIMRQFGVLRTEARDGSLRRRAQMAQLRRELQTTPRFAAFARLPVELRAIIWDLALPRNELKVILEGCGKDVTEPKYIIWSYATRRPPPAISQVCREARSVAYRTGRMVPVGGCLANHLHDNPFGPQWGWFDPRDDSRMVPVGGCFAGGTEPEPDNFPIGRQWSWFDPRKDSVIMDIRAWTSPVLFQAIPTLTPYTKHIILDERIAGRKPVLICVFNQRLFPNLKRVDCKFTPSATQLPPILSAALFGPQSEITIDLDRVEETVPQWSASGELTMFKMSLNNLKHVSIQVSGQNNMKWDEYVRYVSAEWQKIRHSSSALRSTVRGKLNGLDCPGVSTQRKKSMMPRRPSFGRIVEFSRVESSLPEPEAEDSDVESDAFEAEYPDVESDVFDEEEYLDMESDVF